MMKCFYNYDKVFSMMMTTYLAASDRNRSLSPTRISRQLESAGVMTSVDVRYVSQGDRPVRHSSGKSTGMRDLADFSAVVSPLAGDSDELAAIVVVVSSFTPSVWRWLSLPGTRSSVAVLSGNLSLRSSPRWSCEQRLSSYRQRFWSYRQTK